MMPCAAKKTAEYTVGVRVSKAEEFRDYTQDCAAGLPVKLVLVSQKCSRNFRQYKIKQRRACYGERNVENLILGWDGSIVPALQYGVKGAAI
jgi:hypothetical protein